MKGLRTDIPKGMKLQAMTVAVLQAVETEGYCLLECDDGPDSVETEIQLYKICGNVGHYYHKENHRVFVIDSHNIPRISSGRSL